MSVEGTIADLPSGEPVPSSTPQPSQNPPKRPNALACLGAALVSAPSDLDSFLAHLHRCMQTPTGIDCVLQFVCYGSRLSAALLTALLQTGALAERRRSARELVALALSLPPKTAVFFAAGGPATAGTASTPASSPSAAAIRVLAQRLKALSGLLSEARVILRLWALLGMYFWAKRLTLSALRAAPADDEKKEQSPAPSAAATTLQWVQLASCVLFQALENGAYLSSKGVMGWSPANQGKALRWSSRFWGVFVGIELGKLAYQATAAKDRREVRTTSAWRKSMVRNLAWSPLIVHWGSEKGFISEMGIGLLACIPSVIQMRDLWADTAKG